MPIKIKVKKGDTLNTIAKQYGFRNFRDAGISSVPSGNFDLIRPNEEITLQNYDPSKVQTSGAGTPPVISSKDNAQQFQEDKTTLESILAGAKPEAEGEAPADIPKDDAPTAPIDTTEDDVSAIDDPLYVKSRADDKVKIQTATDKMTTDKEDYISSISTRLADIDAVTKSTLERINASAERRINEQIRINTINTDRVRAYGVGGAGEGGGGAIYQPIQFSDAVTERESVGADEVAKLERERDALISQAETASRLGKSTLLTEKLEGVSDIEDKLRTKLSDIEKESDKQYTLLRKIRKDKEDERVKAVKEAQDKLRAFVSLHKDEYENLTPEEIEAKVVEVMKLSNLSYSEAYNAIIEGVQVGVESEEDKAEIAKTKAETKKIEAQTEKIKKGEDTDDDDLTTSQKQSLEQAGLQDAPRNIKLDFLKGELGIDEESVQKFLTEKTTETLKSPDGKQEVSISDLTPEQLEEAKKAGWK